MIHKALQGCYVGRTIQKNRHGLLRDQSRKSLFSSGNQTKTGIPQTPEICYIFKILWSTLVTGNMGWSISKLQPEHLIVIHQISTWHFGFNLSNPSLNWTWANQMSKITTDTEMDHLWYRNSCKKMQGIKLNESLPEKRWKICPFSCGLLHSSISRVFFLDFVGEKIPKAQCYGVFYLHLSPKLPIYIYILVHIRTINWGFLGKSNTFRDRIILGKKTSTLKCKNMYPLED